MQEVYMNDTVYIATNDPTASLPARDYILDSMSGFDADLYRAEIADGRLDLVTVEDWAQFWATGDNVFDTEDAARAYAIAEERRYVLRITIEDVRDALQRAFGASE